MVFIFPIGQYESKYGYKSDSMFFLLCVCIYTGMFMSMYLYVCMFLKLNLRTYVLGCIQECMYVSVFVCLCMCFLCMCVSVFVCACVSFILCMYVLVCIRMYIYIYIYIYKCLKSNGTGIAACTMGEKEIRRLSYHLI